jgi:hypothetical protein
MWRSIAICMFRTGNEWRVSERDHPWVIVDDARELIARFTCLWPFVWFLHFLLSQGIISILDKGNTKRGVSPRLKIRPCDLDLWPWKSIRFQILLRSKYVPSLVKIHWRMLILECSQGCYAVKIWPCDIDLWPMTLKIKRVPDTAND